MTDILMTEEEKKWSGVYEKDSLELRKFISKNSKSIDDWLHELSVLSTGNIRYASKFGEVVFMPDKV